MVVPLNTTVFGLFELTSSEPALTVSAPAMPSTELDDRISEVPLIVTLKRLAVPLSVEEPVKVAVPAVAESVPLTSNDCPTVKPELATTEPLTCKA